MQAWTIFIGGVGVLAGLLLYAVVRVRARASASERSAFRLTELNSALALQVDHSSRELVERGADLQTITRSVAHDLRNPVNTVGLNLHLLRSALAENDAELGTMAVEHIEHAMQQMTGILDCLRSYSLVSFSDLQSDVVDMVALSRDVFAQLEQSEPPPAVDFHVADLPPCRGDEELLRILLLNVVGNALKYTRTRSGRRIEIGYRCEEPAAYYVRDNGPGIDTARVDELFAPLRDAEDHTGGRGMGLAVAARAVYRHGGRIWAVSAEGEGATFYFQLGAATPGTAAQPPATTSVQRAE